MSGSRRLARQYAFVVLCSLDKQPMELGFALEQFWEASSIDESLAPDEQPMVPRTIFDAEKSFAHRIVNGVAEHTEEIDRLISSAAHNWTMERMAMVDRTILRLATYELLFENDIAGNVSLNEAVEMAKKFGEQNSRQFVNGVLDRIASQTKKVTKRKRG